MHVAMATIPMMGHLMPLLPYAEELLRRGHDVTIFHPSAPKYRAKLEDSGLGDCQSVEYEGDWSNLYDCIRNQYTRDDTKNNLPSLMVYDFFATDAGDAAESLDIPSISVFPNMAVTVNPWATTNPDGFVYSFLWCKMVLPILESMLSRLLWMKRSYTRWNRNLPSLSEQDIYPTKYQPKSPILGCTAPALEYNSASKLPSDMFAMVGPALPTVVDPLSTELEEWLQVQGDRKIIYVAFGTMYKYTKESIRTLQRELENVERANAVSILWSLPKEQQKHLYPTTSNWKVLGFCPQIALFRSGCIGCFVTHCGSNSVYEALLNQVPMVACPGFADQPGNAMRLHQAGVGVLMDKKKGIAVAVEEVLENWNIMKDNLARLSKELNDMGGSTKAVSIMEQVVVEKTNGCHAEDTTICRRTPWWPFSLAVVSTCALIAIF